MCFQLVEEMINGTVVAMQLEGPDAVARLRSLAGMAAVIFRLNAKSSAKLYCALLSKKILQLLPQAPPLECMVTMRAFLCH